MILAIASGKGGTGKTTVAVSMAISLAARAQTTLVDLDVEAPNAHLFLETEWDISQRAYIPVPLVDEDRCTRCGACGDLCQFAAIKVLGQTIITFTPMCHGCTGCWTICPEKCISQDRRELGEVLGGKVYGVEGSLRLLMGRSRVGEAMSPPLMKKVMAAIEPTEAVVIDAPPGVSCPAMTACGFADAVLLVTEPTPFGLYDLKLAVSAFSSLGKPLGVVVNRAGLGDDRVYDYCREQGLEILAEIPYDREVALGYSQGQTLGQIKPQWGQRLAELYDHFAALPPAAAPLGAGAGA